MSTEATSNPGPTPIPDPMGRNLPANERVIRGEKWEPDFDPLGQPEPVDETPTPDEDVFYTSTSPDDADIPDAPYYGNPPIAHGKRSHRSHYRRSHHKRHYRGKGLGWLWILFAFAAWKGLSGGAADFHFSWWWLLLCWPLWGMMRGLFGSNRGALATLFIVGGAVMLAQTIGFASSLILPAALLLVGGLLLMRSIGLFSTA